MEDETKGKGDANALFAAAYRWQQEGDFRRAAVAYGEVIRMDPRMASAHNNLGNCFRSVGEFDAALACFDAALSLEPGKGSAQLNKSLALLALNRYAEAWPLYRSRLGVIDFRKEVLSSGKPVWDGRRLDDGERLFLYGNQGLGDEIQMLRYLRRVPERAARVILEIQEPVFELVRNLPGYEEIRVRESKRPLPGFDVQAEIFDLPGIFGTEFPTIPPPWRPPFAPDLEVVRFLSERRLSHPGRKHVGLVWSGNPMNDINRFRACGLVHLLPLLKEKGCLFYSLQMGTPRVDLERFSSESAGIVDLEPLLGNLASTATALDGLDLVITPDTAVAHLAGTIGAPAWVLLHFPSDWRWTTGKDRTPWYPGLRLFRQDAGRDWKPVVGRVARELACFVRSF